MSKYPECNKMLEVQDQSQTIGEFLDWLLHDKGAEIAEWRGDQLFPMRGSIESLLAEFFEIDLEKVEKERRAILEEMRQVNCGGGK